MNNEDSLMLAAPIHGEAEVEQVEQLAESSRDRSGFPGLRIETGSGSIYSFDELRQEASDFR